MKFDIKWLATILFIFGGTSVAVQAPWIKFSFPCFCLGHMILIYDFATTHKNKPLIIQNTYFLVINTIATYIWFFN